MTNYLPCNNNIIEMLNTREKKLWTKVGVTLPLIVNTNVTFGFIKLNNYFIIIFYMIINEMNISFDFYVWYNKILYK